MLKSFDMDKYKGKNSNILMNSVGNATLPYYQKKLYEYLPIGFYTRVCLRNLLQSIKLMEYLKTKNSYIISMKKQAYRTISKCYKFECYSIKS